MSFHNFPIPEVRERYVASCKANGLEESTSWTATDYDVEDFRVRVYEPRPQFKRSQRTAAVLFIHGGGWLMGNLETHHSAARRISILTGLPVVAVDYRLAPEHQYPAAIDDCRAAVRWVSNAFDVHGLDVSSLVIMGDSAGGQLTAVLCNEFASDNAVAPLAAQVLIYPITDISLERTENGASYQRVAGGFPLVADTMRWFIDHYVPADQDRSVADLSPLLHELPENLPPTYVVTVDNDPLTDEGAEYAAALVRAGTDVTYRHLRGYHHGLFTSAGVMTAGETGLADIAEFIKEHAC